MKMIGFATDGECDTLANAGLDGLLNCLCISNITDDSAFGILLE